MCAYKTKPLSPFFKMLLEKVLLEHNHKAHNKEGVVVRDCSRKTRDSRKQTLYMAFTDIKSLGYDISKPQSIRKKHVEALLAYWGAKGLAPRTLHTWVSMLRVFCGWIGKKDVVENIEHYFEPDQIKRSNVATTNLSWVANDIDVADVIAKARLLDERFALYLSLQRCFGLRAKEAIELRPITNPNDKQTHLLVDHGTKGGRVRTLPIETQEQRDVLEWAKKVAITSGGRIRWQRKTWVQARRKFYTFTEQVGITRAGLGVTSHGLRHQFAQSEYRRITGLPTPIEGGAIGLIDRQTHHAAFLIVSDLLGHIRFYVTGSYCGGYGHCLRNARTPEELKRNAPFMTGIEHLHGFDLPRLSGGQLIPN